MEFKIVSWLRRSVRPAERQDVPIFAYLLVKLAARCNLDCSYCYWFRDPAVYEKPHLLDEKICEALCANLTRHILKYKLDEFTVLLHGGEPLLLGKRRFEAFMKQLDAVAESTGCNILRLISTNGVLVDEEWAAILTQYHVYASVSIDGPAHIHDARRRDFRGQGSHARAVRGLETLRRAGVDIGVIAVCDPSTDAAEVAQFIVGDLGVSQFDILPPDATHRDNVTSIAPYYSRLFDSWHSRWGAEGVDIRFVSGVVRGLFGKSSGTDSIGFGPIHTVTLLTDGSLEALDVLRIAGSDVTPTKRNIFDHELQEVAQDADWLRAYDASLTLPQACQACDIRDACGGGHLAHRWSESRGFDNPSVYCEDYKKIFQHAWARLSPAVRAADSRGNPIRLPEAVQ